MSDYDKETYLSVSYGYDEGRILSFEQNGRNVNISTKNVLQVAQYKTISNEAEKKSSKNDSYPHKLNQIIAEKSVGVLINQSLRSSYLRHHIEPVYYSSEYRQLMCKAILNRVNTYLLPPPPGFLYQRTRPLASSDDLTNVRTERNHENVHSDDLDIDAIINEFKQKANINHDYEKTIVTNKFFMMNLKTKVLKYLRANDHDLICRALLDCAAADKSAIGGSLVLLKQIGFDIVLTEDEDAATFTRKHCPRRYISNSKLCDTLAMEFINNDYFADDLINACNKHLKSKKRMDYTKSFGDENL